MSKVSRAINTAFVERQNGTDRHRNARKARKTYRFSKDWRYHEAVTYLTMYVYNFCWPVRTLRVKDDRGRWQNAEPGDGGRAGGSCLVDARMARVPSRATLIGHEENIGGSCIQAWRMEGRIRKVSGYTDCRRPSGGISCSQSRNDRSRVWSLSMSRGRGPRSTSGRGLRFRSRPSPGWTRRV